MRFTTVYVEDSNRVVLQNCGFAHVFIHPKTTQRHTDDTAQAEIVDTLSRQLIMVHKLCYDYCLIIFGGLHNHRLTHLKVGSLEEIAFFITRNLQLKMSLVVLKQKTSTFSARHFDRRIHNQAKHVVRSQ